MRSLRCAALGPGRGGGERQIRLPNHYVSLTRAARPSRSLLARIRASPPPLPPASFLLPTTLLGAFHSRFFASSLLFLQRYIPPTMPLRKKKNAGTNTARAPAPAAIRTSSSIPATSTSTSSLAFPTNISPSPKASSAVDTNTSPSHSSQTSPSRIPVSVSVSVSASARSRLASQGKQASPRRARNSSDSAAHHAKVAAGDDPSRIESVVRPSQNSTEASHSRSGSDDPRESQRLRLASAPTLLRSPAAVSPSIYGYTQASPSSSQKLKISTLTPTRSSPAPVAAPSPKPTVSSTQEADAVFAVGSRSPSMGQSASVLLSQLGARARTSSDVSVKRAAANHAAASGSGSKESPEGSGPDDSHPPSRPASIVTVPSPSPLPASSHARSLAPEPAPAMLTDITTPPSAALAESSAQRAAEHHASFEGAYGEDAIHALKRVSKGAAAARANRPEHDPAVMREIHEGESAAEGPVVGAHEEADALIQQDAKEARALQERMRQQEVHEQRAATPAFPLESALNRSESSVLEPASGQTQTQTQLESESAANGHKPADIPSSTPPATASGTATTDADPKKLFSSTRRVSFKEPSRLIGPFAERESSRSQARSRIGKDLAHDRALVAGAVEDLLRTASAGLSDQDEADWSTASSRISGTGNNSARPRKNAYRRKEQERLAAVEWADQPGSAASIALTLQTTGLPLAKLVPGVLRSLLEMSASSSSPASSSSASSSSSSSAKVSAGKTDPSSTEQHHDQTRAQEQEDGPSSFARAIAIRIIHQYLPLSLTNGSTSRSESETQTQSMTLPLLEVRMPIPRFLGVARITEFTVERASRAAAVVYVLLGAS